MQGRRSLNNHLLPPLEPTRYRRARTLRLEQPEPTLRIEFPETTDRAEQSEPILRIEYPAERVEADQLEPELVEMDNHEEEVRIEMREFAKPLVGTSRSCIRLGEAARNYELKGMYYDMLPSFYGMPTEDPLSFIREFYSVIEQMPLECLMRINSE